MKNSIRKALRAIVATGTLVTATAVLAQTSITTTTLTETPPTMTAGTISEFGMDSMTIRSDTSPKMLPYSHSKTTTYEDESGVPVAVQTVKAGQPVTVYYTQVGDQMVASRVVVRKATVLEEKTTTETTH